MFGSGVLEEKYQKRLVLTVSFCWLQTVSNNGSNKVNEPEDFAVSIFQSTDLFVMASNSFQQAKAIFEVVNNVHNEVSNRRKNFTHSLTFVTNHAELSRTIVDFQK